VQAPARLRQLSDAADPRTRTFEARYVMDGAGASAPLGSTVTIGFESSRVTGTLSVPLGAIDDEGRGPGVWIVDPKTSKVAYRPVQIRSLSGEAAEISGGLGVGEIVVVTGGHYLHEGENVRAAPVRAAMQ
jgi:multidrug efflux pump subunit AcrA (membrane-fusion protein)